MHESKTKERYAANHGLWLGSQICHLLCSELGTSLQELEHKSSVTAEVSDEVKASSATGLRVNKRRLLEFLAADVDVQWEHQLEDVTIQDNKIICAFKNGSTTEGRALIGADGVHSRGRPFVSYQSPHSNVFKHRRQYVLFYYLN